MGQNLRLSNAIENKLRAPYQWGPIDFIPMTPGLYSNYPELIRDLQTDCNGRFKNINDVAENPHEAFNKLSRLICLNLARLAGNGISHDDIEQVQAIILDAMVGWHHWRENEQVVEAWALIWAYKDEKDLDWSLKVIWDSDYPDPSSGILPHFGYEIYFDNKRVSGPGHVYMTDYRTRYHRDAQPMREVGKNSVCDQASGGRPGSTRELSNERRLDYAARFWALGRDGEIWQEGMSEQEYQREIQKPHVAWETYYKRPCFGLS